MQFVNCKQISFNIFFTSNLFVFMLKRCQKAKVKSGLLEHKEDD